jgi:GNAT superfamily N-acetyltransferase
MNDASPVRIAALDPRHPHARRCIEAYYRELARRFDAGFDPDRSNPAADEDLTPPAGLFLVATRDDEPVACGALKFHGDEPAEVKRMWVDPAVRGIGLGRRMLTALETAAAQAGARTLRLETNGALAEAIGLYRAAGFHEVDAFNDEPYAHHWFEKTLGGM